VIYLNPKDNSVSQHAEKGASPFCQRAIPSTDTKIFSIEGKELKRLGVMSYWLSLAKG
jgi:hypothetical protein